MVRKSKALRLEPHMINFKEMAKKSTKFDNKRMNHMVYLNHLSANRNVKKKGIKDSDEINFLRTLKSFEDLKEIIKRELENVFIDFVHKDEDQDQYILHKEYISKAKYLRINSTFV